ncbi:TPA: response regulator [Candidatus Sumerlaeota bacterium]|nr:response regulator [Candidatus Sumerlaeota bacterium]
MDPSDSRSIHILLVEDSPSDVYLTTRALKEAKVLNELYVAEDGVEALDFLYQRGNYTNAPRPDIIFLDLNLPRKSGREVLAEVKSDPALASIPVVVLTTSQAEEDILETYALHANCYVTKPVDLTQFLGAIKAIQGFWLDVVRLPPEPRK